MYGVRWEMALSLPTRMPPGAQPVSTLRVRSVCARFFGQAFARSMIAAIQLPCTLMIILGVGSMSSSFEKRFFEKWPRPAKRMRTRL